jgi:hypothetical protein
MRKIIINVQWLIISILWVYILYRAIFIAITQDEAYSYLLIKTNNWQVMPGSLNTHWLNTLTMRLFLWLPGVDHVWKLRIISVLSWWLYSYSAIKLSAVFNNKYVGFAFFLAAVSNPFLILYFSLARGYAVSCAFILFSLRQVFLTLQRHQMFPENWLKVFLPASIAVLANFSSFYFFIGASSIYILHLLLNKKISFLFKTSAIRLKLLIIVTCVFATFSLLFIRFHTKEFEGSETSDLIYSLFGSQIRYGSYLNFGTSLTSLVPILFLVLVIFIIISCYQYYSSKNMTIVIFSLLVSGVIILCNIVFYQLYKTPYLYGRTGLMFYVTLLPGFFGIMDTWEPKRNFLKVGLNSLMILIVLVFIVNLYKGFSPNYFSEWPFQTDTQKSLDYLQDANAKHVGLTLWHFSVFSNYYSKAFPNKYKFSTVLIDENIKPNPIINNCDYLIVTIPDSSKNVLLDGWNIKFSNSATKIMILSKNK